MSQVITHDSLKDNDTFINPGVLGSTVAATGGKLKVITSTFGNVASNARFVSDFTGVNGKDTPAKSYFRNYAREYVLNDGSMGVDHVNTRNSGPIHLDNDDGTNLNDIGGFDYVNFSTNSLKERKRVLFNHESSVN